MDWGAVSTHPIVAGIAVVLTTATVLGGVKMGQRVLAEIRDLAIRQRKLDGDLRGHMQREEAERREDHGERAALKTEIATNRDQMWQMRAEMAAISTHVKTIDIRTTRIEQKLDTAKQVLDAHTPDSGGS